MGIIKHRPRISLLVEREIKVGGNHHANVVVDADREVSIEWLRIDLQGNERGSIGSGDHKTTKSWRFLNLRAELSGARTIPVGRTEFPVRFDIPSDVPPSFRGRSAWTEYSAEVRASISWWPDAKESFEVHVSVPWRPGPEDRPLLFSTDPSGPKAREPHVEGSLASSVYEPGAVVTGALALNNVAYNDYKALDVGLVAFESVTLPNRRPTRNEHSRYAVRLTTTNPVEGASIPFKFRLPETVPITYTSALWKLEWAFEAHARISWAGDLHLQVPITLIPPSKEAKKSPKPQHAPPTVGSERVERIWREVAEALGLVYDSDGMRGATGDVELRVWREHRGREGVFLVGGLSYHSLHLDLAIEPARGLRRAFRSGFEFIDPPWDRRHHVEGREGEQISAFGALLREVLPQFETVQMDDSSAQVENRGSGQSGDELTAFCEHVKKLAAVIEPARAAIPPPPSMSEGIEAWKELAERLRTSLETARMAVQGELDGMPVAVITEWSPEGRPVRTQLIVSPVVPVASEYHVVLTPQEDGVVSLDNWSLPRGAVQEAARKLLTDALGFELSAERLRLSLPAPVSDPRPLIPRLIELARLAVLLRPGAGPFR